MEQRHRLSASMLAGMLLALVPGALGNIFTGTKFPWEQCRQNTRTSIYSATFDTYYKTPGGKGWTACWRIVVKDQDLCHQMANFPDNATRCCDTDFNKFKFYPAPECRTAGGHAVDGLLINGIRTSNYGWDDFSKITGGSWIMKITNLKLTPQTAHGTQICLLLKPPCETLEKFAFDHEVLEWNLYDKKRENYECCPAGVTAVPYEAVAPSWVDVDTPPPPPKWKKKKKPPSSPAKKNRKKKPPPSTSLAPPPPPLL